MAELTQSLGSWRKEAEASWGRWTEVSESRGWGSMEIRQLILLS